MVKRVSVQLVSLILHYEGLHEICRDIGNAFIQADIQEMVYIQRDPVFRAYKGIIVDKC